MKYSYLLILFAGTALASDDERGPNVDVESIATATATGGAGGAGGNANNNLSNSIGGNSSRAYGFGLGDVDIAQCYRSYQLLIWQDSKINPFCVADAYDQKGLHGMAAVIRCDIGFIRKHFDNDRACLAANTMAPTLMPTVPDLGAVYDQAAKDVMKTHDDDEEIHRDQIVEQQQYLADLEARFDQLDATRRANMARYEREQAQLRQYAQDALEQLPEQKNEPR
jgi:hypothetical protein